MNFRNDLIYDRTYAVVDLDAIRENITEAKKALPHHMQFCAVVKADGYGHGAPAVAKNIDDLVDMYAVATVEEGCILRQHGIWKPILNLGVVPESSYTLMLEQDIMPSVFTLSQAEKIDREAEKMGIIAPITLAVDTGMGRIGILAEDPEGVATAEAIARMPHLSAEGIFSHFASADVSDKRFAELQYRRFMNFTEALEQRGIHIPVKHCANSAGILEGLGTEMDMVRDGISLYGLYPSGEVDRTRIHLRPALSWKANVSYVKTVPAGTTVSYGSIFTADREMEIATLPVGYADGYPRALSNQAEVLIHGHRCRQLGRVCMDQIMVDVTGLGVKINDVATLLGRDGEEKITLYDWEKFGLFRYEVLCNIGKRVPRVYIRNGGIVGTHNAYDEQYEDFL